MKCRVCGTEMELTEVLRNKERNITTLYNIPGYKGERRDIQLYKCPYCTHM